MTSTSDQPSLRLMVLAPNWLGDVVMHTPLLSVLDEARHDIQELTGRRLFLSLGVRRAWADLFLGDPRIDEVFVLERSGNRRGIRDTIRLAARLKAEKLEAVILGPPSFRTALVSWLAGIPGRVGFRTDGRSLLVTEGLAPLPRGRRHYSGEMVDLGRAWLESLGVESGVESGKVPPTSLPGCAALPPTIFGDGRPVWAVAPGTTYGEAKTWPLGRVGEFVARAVDEGNVRVALLGDAAAAVFAQRLRDGFHGSWGHDPGEATDVVDLTGRTDLAAAVGVLKSADAFIGNDSGLMHVAAALERPTVGIFGSSNPAWTSPVGPHARAIVPEGFSCRPCYRKTCNQPEFCLDSVGAQLVFDTVRELVSGAGTLGEGN